MTIGENIEKLLKRLFTDRITFDDGSYIEYLHREAITYVEGDRELELMWYFDNGVSFKKRTMSISENFKYWDSPHEDESIGNNKRDEIINKIKLYSDKRKTSLSIVD